MTSRELLKGVTVDINRLIDSFAERVQQGASLTFATFKEVWKTMHMSFTLVCAPSEDEIGSHIQEMFMSALDRLDLPSPLKYGQHFGEMHKPRLRRPGSVDKSVPFDDVNIEEDDALIELDDDEDEGNEVDYQIKKDATPFCDPFRKAPDFPKEELQRLIAFEERVCVIYVLYTVYNVQCLEPRVRIHFPLDLLPFVAQFLPKLVERNAMDAASMFKRLWSKKAFVFDVQRRPPSYLALPVEQSPSEASALRELSFHLKTSLQELERCDTLETTCDVYASLQEEIARCNLGQSHKASEMMLFNGGIGKWLGNAIRQESKQVQEGITGMRSNEERPSKATFSTPKKTKNKTGAGEEKEKKRKWMASLPKIAISGDDSWGINAPGLPKMARVVMMRDRERRKAADQNAELQPTEDVGDRSPSSEKRLMSSTHSQQQDPIVSEEETEICSADFYEECSELRRFLPQTIEPSLESIPPPQAEETADGRKEAKQTDISADDSDDDSEIRQLREDVKALNAQINNAFS